MPLPYSLRPCPQGQAPPPRPQSHSLIPDPQPLPQPFARLLTTAGEELAAVAPREGKVARDLAQQLNHMGYVIWGQRSKISYSCLLVPCLPHLPTCQLSAWVLPLPETWVPCLSWTPVSPVAPTLVPLPT